MTESVIWAADWRYQKLGEPIEGMKYGFKIPNSNSHKSIEKDCVMEIKASNDINDDYLEKIMINQTERFSKYCNGVKSFLY